MKKIVISLLAICLSVSIVLAATPKKKEKPSDYAIGIKYEQALKSDKPSVLLFYTNWCTYCRRFMPMFESLSTEYQDRYNFVMVNAEKNEEKAAFCRNRSLCIHSHASDQSAFPEERTSSTKQ